MKISLEERDHRKRDDLKEAEVELNRIINRFYRFRPNTIKNVKYGGS